eukprot:scaffold2879_cov269-Prasinococcus_capsulatus_cf.AAC.17
MQAKYIVAGTPPISPSYVPWFTCMCLLWVCAGDWGFTELVKQLALRHGGRVIEPRHPENWRKVSVSARHAIRAATWGGPPGNGRSAGSLTVLQTLYEYDLTMPVPCNA